MGAVRYLPCVASPPSPDSGGMPARISPSMIGASSVRHKDQAACLTPVKHQGDVMIPNVRRVAVLGAGVMGAQIAAHLANANVPVTLFDLAAPEGNANGIVTK